MDSGINGVACAVGGNEHEMGSWGKRDDMVVHETEPYNAEPPPHALADRVLTPIDSFYVHNHGPIPLIDTQTWRLTVDGLVEHPLSLSRKT
jgi:sulfite oxidase